MIKYVKGDATRPIDDEGAILHIVNDLGAWGAGFTAALDKRWPDPRELYLWTKMHYPGRLRLGNNQWVRVSEQCEKHGDLYVVNLVAQHGVRGVDNPMPLDYAALRTCLMKFAERCIPPLPVHMPRIGCGLAGGDWSKVEVIVAEELKDFDVTVYDL